MSDYKYTIIEANEDPQLAVIRKEGLTAEFSLSQIESDKKQAEKMREQIEAQIKLDEAQMQNVINNHPYVLEVTEEEVKRAVAISLYNGLKNTVAEQKERISKFEELLAEHQAELNDIREQTGLNI